MIGFWNDDEDGALQGLSLEAQVIYLRGIRRFANKDGVAGIDRRINRASLSEVCHHIPPRGSRKPESRPSWDAVRRRLDELEAAGLIIPRGNLVFDLPLAARDESALRRMTRGRHDDDTVSPTRSKQLCDNDSGRVDDTRMTRSSMSDDDTTSPVTINNTYPSNAREASATVVPLKRPIPADFRVSPAVMSWAIHRGYGDPTPHLEHFINTCHANGYLYADHDAAFKKAVADDWARLRSSPRQERPQTQGKAIPDNNTTGWLRDEDFEVSDEHASTQH